MTDFADRASEREAEFLVEPWRNTNRRLKTPPASAIAKTAATRYRKQSEKPSEAVRAVLSATNIFN